MNITPRTSLVVGALTAVCLAAVGSHAALAKSAAKGGGKEVAIIQTSMGNMTVEFYEKEAPKTVANFKALARRGFYDGVKFHRIIAGFMVQTGDPNTKTGRPETWGTGGSGTTVPAEFSHTLKHTEGTVSMARSADPNSASSQFFICLADAPHLDGQYTAFGKVVKGLDVLRKLGKAPVKASPMGEKSLPVRPPVVKKITIRAI
jgi:peptidyl-prolyl cis-trans isomerase B (cyclophilin B)